MPSYSDVQRAARVEKTRLWFGWVTGNILALLLARATKNFAVVSVLTQILAVVVFLALTVAVFRLTGALNRRADQARREVLGDDYPGCPGHTRLHGSLLAAACPGCITAGAGSAPEHGLIVRPA